MRLMVLCSMFLLGACAGRNNDRADAAFRAQEAESKALEASEPKDVGANPDEPVNPPPAF